MGGFHMKVLAKTPGLYQVPKLRNATTTTATTTTILELGGKINKENKIQSVHLTDFVSNILFKQTLYIQRFDKRPLSFSRKY